MSAKYFKNRNINLAKLKNVVENYFKSQEYETQSKSGERDHIVQARKTGTLRAVIGSSRVLTITISGESNDFSVSIAEGKWASNIAAVGIGAILTMGISLIPAALGAGWSKQIEAEFNSWLDDLIQFSSSTIVAEKSISHGKPKESDMLTKLKSAFETGILTKDEYEEKISKLRTGIDLDEQQKKLRDLYDAGILNEQEYMTKKNELDRRTRVNKLNQALANGIITREEYENKLSE